jgi:hypothetical protein
VSERRELVIGHIGGAHAFSRSVDHHECLLHGNTVHWYLLGNAWKFAAKRDHARIEVGKAEAVP